MIQALLLFGDEVTEQRTLTAVPAIDDTITGPRGEPWKIIGIFRTPDEVRLTCAPALGPARLTGDATGFSLKS